MTASDFAKRLSEVTEKETQDGLTTTTQDGSRGIVLKVSARDWEYSRLVLYHQITDKDVEYAIRKIEYVIAEYEALLK